jgi:CPA2 family monovalent cation:H+ antiporter-2
VVERDDPLGHPQALATLGPGDVFGEIALLDHVPRTATVRATEAAELLVLSRANFERLVLSELSAEKVRRTIQIGSFLRRCDLFAEWPDQAVVEVSIEFAFRGFEPGQTAVRQGEANKTFFLVYEGQFEVRVDGVHRRVMGPGDFFGEISLLAGGLATATVTALEPGRCLVLDREQFIGFVSQDSLTGYLIESVAESRQS